MLKRAASAGARDLINCDAYCFGTPDYFSYMAGMLKDFFDRAFYKAGGIKGRPCGLFVTHGGGGKASRSVEDMRRTFKLRAVGRTVLVEGKPDAAARAALRRLGAAVARAALKA